jgi:GDPmannose 4,6-dehydratase
MWRMLQQDKPDDFILATGETHSVKEFIDAVFSELEMDLDWKGEEEQQVGIMKKDGKTLIEVDPRYYRPTEVELLIGNPAKAKEKLGWAPKTTFRDLAKMMAKADYEKVKRRGY